VITPLMLIDYIDIDIDEHCYSGAEGQSMDGRA
jgi:hypothetical protein